MTEITLSKPVVHESVTYALAEISEPSVGGIEAYEKAKAAGATDLTAMIDMLAVDLGWPAGAIRKIKASDLARISEALAPFVPAAEQDSGPAGAPSALTSPTG
jgi:hypothetical protein